MNTSTISLEGNLRKLSSELNYPIIYQLLLGNESLHLNQLLGRKINFEFLNEINCIQCQRKTSKSFQQGYCYPCYRRLAECNLCIIHPERCCYPEANCPNDWAHEHCTQPHVVYLANSSGLKVGVTRASQVPTRWIDQGASQAIKLFQVGNRYHSGLFEVALKEFVADKTNWRKMLSSDINLIDLKAEKKELLAKAAFKIEGIINQTVKESFQPLDDDVLNLEYPVKIFPSHLNSFDLDKNASFSGSLVGIKGQYLLFDTGIINVRKYGGYKVRFSTID